MAGTAETQEDSQSSRIHEIWLIGLAELHAKTGTVDFWKYYGELQLLKRRPLDTRWLEAAISMAVVGRIRPARVTGYLNKLRNRRVKNGKRAEFDAFDALLRSFLYPERLTNHGFKINTFRDINHSTVWEQVSQHLTSLTSAGYDVFLNSGTLLGVVRDKKLIDHDDDIDLALILKSDTEEAAAQEWQEIKTMLERLDLFDEENYQGGAIYKLLPVGDIQIDLFPAWQSDGQFFVYPHTHGILSCDEVLPLRICELTGHALPSNPEKMLEINYGADWRDPDPLFKFPWASANQAFGTFLERVEG